MNDQWKELLQEMVILIQEYQNTTAVKNYAKVEKAENSIRNIYKKLCQKNEEEKFFRYLYQEFGNEAELYSLLISILYRATSDEKCLQAVMDYLIEGRTDIFYSIYLRKQAEYSMFTNACVGRNYELRRKVHKVQLEQLEKLINVQYPYIPWEDRNDNKVIVITNQFLSDFHAPTRNVNELCSALTDMGKDVILIIVIEKDDVNYGGWYNYASVNYIDEFNGGFTNHYYGHEIKAYQILFSNDSLSEIKSLINDIYYIKPQFIWYMGGTSLFADLFREWTTVISMPFTDGYSISEAPIMIEYMKSKSADNDRMDSYLAKENQIPIHFYFEQVIRPSLIPHSRQEFHLPENGFLITIVGNRLETEINDEFIVVLNRILEISPRIHIVFIGSLERLNGIDETRATFLEIQLDLLGVLNLMDLFLNPPRKGGGTGAYWSLFNSIPVVTFNHCDVANCVNEEFICKDADEMVTMVERHVMDRQYHLEMKKKAKQIINEIEKKNDLKANIKALISNVKAASEIIT